MTFDLDYNSVSQIRERTSKIYLANEYYLKETEVNDYLLSFLENEIYSSNLEIIISQLDDFLNYEGEDQTSLLNYNAVNKILLTLENFYLAQNIGFNGFVPQANNEFMGDSNNLVNTITRIIGYKELTSIIEDDDDTITATLGNIPLSSFILFNDIINPTSTISDQLELYRKIFSVAIGQDVALNIAPSLDLHSCESSAIIGSSIYATSSQPSLTEGINAFFACATWASAPEYNGIIDLSRSNICSSSIGISLFSNCLNLLSGETYD